MTIKIDQSAFDDYMQSVLDYANAEAYRLGLPIGATICGIVGVAMALSVDRCGGDVDAGERDVITLAEMTAAQMREWTPEERLLAVERAN